jgi:glycosyltransferase involved in cell wall biosynthesis
MDRPLRFCMITTFYPPYHFGGDGVFVQQLSNELAERGHQVEVVHCRDAYHAMGGRAPSTTYRDHPNITVHTLESPLGFFSPLLTHQSGRPILKSSRVKEILDKPFDVIHYHNISLVGGPKILEYGQGIKLYTLHEYWLVCPTHMLFKFNREVCTHKQCFSCTLVHRRPLQFWRYTGMIERSVKHVDLFIAPSEFSKKKHLEMGLKVPVVELPYFTSRWQCGEVLPKRSRCETPYFLFVGRLEKIKGLQTLIPLFRHYKKAQLWVVGIGDYGPVLREMAGDCPNIKFLRNQSGEQLRILYEQAVATIVPSLWYEVFGIVILEAFARGTPVIVRNRGGMPKIIEESGGGFVYDTDKELLSAMDQLLSDQNLREKIGRRGYETLRKKWHPELHIQRYLELVEQIARSKRAKLGREEDVERSRMKAVGAK